MNSSSSTLTPTRSESAPAPRPRTARSDEAPLALDVSSPTARILVVDDHAKARESIAAVLRHAQYHVDCCASAVEGLERLEDESYDVVITDLRMPGMTGLEFIRQMQQRKLGVQIVMVTAHATVASAVEAMRHGAFDFIEKPFDVDQIEQLVGRAIAHGAMLDHQRPFPRSAPDGDGAMVGSSRTMQALRQRIDQVAPTAETLLISGESGTGKELVARSVHQRSDRRAAALVSLNCPVLSAHLLESELFGHERGAFTGADASRIGRFELANDGTILLDEITEMDLSLQAKLLRVLQERQFERVGSSETLHVDVRVLATTNRDLKVEVAAGRFREDLYYRLAVLPLHVPPLRERLDDVPELVDHFLAQTAARLRRSPCQFDEDARDLLSNYHWPGNIRELENIVTRAAVLSDATPVTADQLRPWLIDPRGPREQVDERQIPVGLSLEAMERKLIEATLEQYRGHRAKTAKALGIGIRTLSGKLKSYGYAPRTKQFGSSSSG